MIPEVVLVLGGLILVYLFLAGLIYVWIAVISAERKSKDTSWYAWARKAIKDVK